MWLAPQAPRLPWQEPAVGPAVGRCTVRVPQRQTKQRAQYESLARVPMRKYCCQGIVFNAVQLPLACGHEEQDC